MRPLLIGYGQNDVRCTIAEAEHLGGRCEPPGEDGAGLSQEER